MGYMGSSYDIPKVIFYLLKGDYRLSQPKGAVSLCWLGTLSQLPQQRSCWPAASLSVISMAAKYLPGRGCGTRTLRMS